MAIFPNKSDPSLELSNPSSDEEPSMVPRSCTGQVQQSTEPAGPILKQSSATVDSLNYHFGTMSLTEPATEEKRKQNQGVTSIQQHSPFGHCAAEVCSQNCDGDTALHLAIIHRALSTVLSLLYLKVDPYYFNIRNNLQQTPLHLAVLTGQALVARHLVVRGADLEARDKKGNTPLHLACLVGSLDLVRALTRPVGSAELKEHNLNENPQKTLPNANLLNYNGDSALHLAATQGHVSVLRYLLLAPGIVGDVNVPDGRSGRTILHLAVESRNTLVLIFLIQNRVALKLDTSAVTYSGHSAMALAMSWRHYDVVNLLKIVGAEHCTIDSDGSSASESEESDCEMADM